MMLAGKKSRKSRKETRMAKDFQQKINELYKLKSLVTLIKQQGLDKDPDIQDDLILYSELGDGGVADVIVEDLIRRLEDKLIEGEAFPPPPEGVEFSGDIFIGMIPQTDQGFFISLDDLSKGFLGSGITGKGKTNLEYHLATEVARLNAGVRQIFLDTMKPNWRHMIDVIPDLLVTRWEDGFPKINPLRPVEGVHPDVHLQENIDNFGTCFGLYASSQTVLGRNTQEVYQKYGVQR
jgi:hypothetical protein